MFAKPKDGLVILDPHTLRPLPAEGAEVEESSYWLRRLQDEDIVVVKKPPAAAAEDAKPAKPGKAGGDK